MSEVFSQAMKTISLDRMKYAVQDYIPRGQLAHSMNIRSFVDHVSDGLILRLTAEVLADKLPPVVERASTTVAVDVPASWFQHLKQSAYRWRRLWRLKRRWPARMRTVTRRVELTVNLERYRTYPEATYVLPPDTFGRPVLAHSLTRDLEVR